MGQDTVESARRAGDTMQDRRALKPVIPSLNKAGHRLLLNTDPRITVATKTNRSPFPHLRSPIESCVERPLHSINLSCGIILT